MDTGDYPSLGRLAQFNAQIAAQNARVAAVVDIQLDPVERLFRAAAEDDWQAAIELSEQLAVQLAESEDQSLIAAAQDFRQALRCDPSGAMAKRPLAFLLAACREAKLRRQSGD